MAFPTEYTETTLKAYLHGELGNTATVLGWTVAGGDYDEPVYDALFDMGEDTIAEITAMADLQKLRILAKLAAWRKAMAGLVDKYDVSADATSLKRSQMYKHAEAQVEALSAYGYGPSAEALALRGGRIEVQPLDYSAEDPHTTDELE